MPLGAKASCRRNSARASNASLTENAKQSPTSIATIAHRTPASTLSTMDHVRSHATEPTASGSAIINNTGAMTRAKCLIGTNHSITWFATCTAPSGRMGQQAGVAWESAPDGTA